MISSICEFFRLSVDREKRSFLVQIQTEAVYSSAAYFIPKFIKSINQFSYLVHLVHFYLVSSKNKLKNKGKKMFSGMHYTEHNGKKFDTKKWWCHDAAHPFMYGHIVVIFFTRLNQVGHIDRHLLDPSIVELLYVMQCSFVFLSDKIDSNTFPAESSSTANAVVKRNKFFWLSSVRNNSKNKIYR